MKFNSNLYFLLVAAVSGDTLLRGIHPRPSTTTGLERGLAMMMDHDHSGFSSLTCNQQMNEPCESWSQQSFNPTVETVLIPCGKCVYMDTNVPANLSLPKGLNIEGKLVFPDGFKVTIDTPFLVVQGELEMTSSRATSSEEDIKIIMTSSPNGGDVSFIPHPENAMACPSGSCSLGKRPIAIAGGTVNIKGLPDTCPTWVNLKNVVTTEPSINPSSLPAYVHPAEGCSDTLVETNFEGNQGISWPNGWYRNYGGTHSYETDNSATPGSTYALYKGRTSTWNGPQTNFDATCIVPGVTYFIYAKARLTKPGGYSNCHQYGTDCLKLTSYMKDSAPDGSPKSPRWNGRGRSSQHNDGEWFEFTSTTTFTEEDANAETALDRRLYWEGPEAGVEIALDDIRIFRLHETSFPSESTTSSEFCSELIPNGDAEDTSYLPFTYPASSKNGFLSVETEGDEANGTLNHFYALRHRQYGYASPNYFLPVDCIEKDSVYSINMDIRVHSNIPQEFRMEMAITNQDGSKSYVWVGRCPMQDSSDGWVTCTSSYQFTESHGAATKMELYLVSFNNWLGDADFDNLSMSFQSGPIKSLVLPDPDGSLAACWGENSELLVTSSNLNFDDVFTPTIKSVTSNGDNTVTLALNEPIGMSSFQDSEADYAVEVALLSRNIMFSSDSLEYSNGGHTIFYHTNRYQYLDGVAFKNFGQQGSLGRYPVHFHMCGSTEHPQVSRNVVRQSNQRCFVLHSSHNVTLDSNICYDNFGHGFLLEDHSERDNTIINNLAAVTKKVITKIRAEETDDVPSSFWITNAENTFIGNVAAGSEHSGFWFEMKQTVRGPSASLPENAGYNPREQPLKAFINNIAHSNNEHGIKTYPGNGYWPKGETAVFKACKSYRNAGDGVFIHNSGNIKVEGGLYADNRVQIDLDRSPGCTVDGARIVGYSEEYRKIKEMTNVRGHCPSGWPLRGIELHSYWAGGTNYLGSTVTNTHFEMFGDTGCADSVAILIDDENKGYFDVRSEISNLTFDAGSKPLSNCATEYSGLDNFVLHDADGSIMSQPGYIVADTPALTTFANCVSDAESCTAHCAGACFRTYALSVSTLEDPSAVELEITDLATNEIITIHSSYEIPLNPDGSTNVAEHTKTHRDNIYFAALPSGGDYSARFTKYGQDHWPVFVRTDYDDPGTTCPPFNSFTLLKPDDNSCHELIRNGDMESGIEGWWATMGGVISVDESASGQGLALTSEYRTSYWMGPAQYLDTRCLPVGAVYTASAKVKLVSKSIGQPVSCDSTKNECPKLIMKLESGAHQERDQRWSRVAYFPSTDSWDANGWNVISGGFTVNQEVADAGSALVYFESRLYNDILMVIDDVTIQLDTWPSTR